MWWFFFFFFCLCFCFFFFFKQKTAYEILAWLEFRRVLFRSHWIPDSNPLDSGFRPSGFRILNSLDSGFPIKSGFRIPSQIWIPDSNIVYSGFQQPDFAGFRIPDSVTWVDILHTWRIVGNYLQLHITVWRAQPWPPRISFIQVFDKFDGSHDKNFLLPSWPLPISERCDWLFGNQQPSNLSETCQNLVQNLCEVATVGRARL